MLRSSNPKSASSVIGFESSIMLFTRLKMCLMNLSTEALRRKVAKGGSIGKQVHSFLSTSNPLAFRFKMGHKMKNLRESLDKIAADKSKFNLTERVVVVDGAHVVHRKREMAHSYVDASNIIGRDQDKENIVSILMQSSSDEQENVSVIPIIGIGGLGKTTLAKLVELIQFWLAHGLIQPSSQNQDLEDIGNEYITELCSISFFQDVQDCKFCVYFKMHDLVHDLAKSVAQFEQHTLDAIEKINSNEVQHVLLSGDDPEEVLTLLQKITKLRTILFRNGGATSLSFVTTCASKFKYMRYLDLSDSSFEVLPSSIGNMKHLRYLSLLRNKRIKKLPASICKLYHLQTLILAECSELEELPRDMGNLINLITLVIVGCPSLVSLPTSVKHLPALENLQPALLGYQWMSQLQRIARVTGESHITPGTSYW
ncbi:unnamed protein product, partial [Vitis vinifera]